MSRLIVATLVALVVAAPAQAAISVTNDRTEITTKLGHKFTFRSRIENRGATAGAGHGDSTLAAGLELAVVSAPNRVIRNAATQAVAATETAVLVTCRSTESRLLRREDVRSRDEIN